MARFFLATRMETRTEPAICTHNITAIQLFHDVKQIRTSAFDNFIDIFRIVYKPRQARLGFRVQTAMLR